MARASAAALTAAVKCALVEIALSGAHGLQNGYTLTARTVRGRRYRRRVEALTEAGPSSYRVPARCGVAPAGDTVEIVRVVNGRGHGQVAGLWIRASARFCAAYQDQVKTRLPAARVFTPCSGLTPGEADHLGFFIALFLLMFSRFHGNPYVPYVPTGARGAGADRFASPAL